MYLNPFIFLITGLRAVVERNRRRLLHAVDIECKLRRVDRVARGRGPRTDDVVPQAVVDRGRRVLADGNWVGIAFQREKDVARRPFPVPCAADSQRQAGRTIATAQNDVPASRIGGL